jgi:protein-disulfide isomerase
MITMLKGVQESPRRNLIEKIVPVLLVVSLVLAFVVGVLWEKVSGLEKGGVAAPATTTTTTAANAGATQPNVTLDTIKGLFSKDLVKFGDAKRKVLFVEISDPSCPYCQAATGLNPKLNQQMDPTNNTFKLISDGGKYDPPVLEMKKLVDAGKASFVYIYYPGHGNGEMGMKALYCANEKGKFWEANELLMTDAGYTLMNTTVLNDKTKSGTVADFLKSAVDATFMKSCLDSGKYDSRLANDQVVAKSLGVQGTPGFFVNATVFAGAYSYTDMKSAVDAALK